jgi:uncharacterized iron-regulated membrane protein
MLQAYLLRFHRWTTLVFALPLLVLIFTGLILSFQPIVQSLSITPGSLDAGKISALISQYDPQAKARGLSIDPTTNSMRLQISGAPVDIDLTTGERVQSPSGLREIFQWARRTHERLLSGFGWLVATSTIAMLVIMTLGVLMGLPRLRNTISGWHKGMAWGLLPLLVLSPLTGLFLSFGVTIGQAPAPAARPVPLLQAVRMVGEQHDLSRLASLGQRGGRMLAILDNNGSQSAFMVSQQGLTPQPRNWSRSLHEGTWSAILGSSLNVLVSIALLGLLGTGLVIWGRRTFRRRPNRAQRGVPATASAPASETA